MMYSTVVQNLNIKYLIFFSKIYTFQYSHINTSCHFLGSLEYTVFCIYVL
jgi:hypothetical protein